MKKWVEVLVDVFKIISIIFLLILILSVWFLDVQVSASRLVGVFGISLNISTILFGLLGIWISTVYNFGINNLSKQEDVAVYNSTIDDINYLIPPLIFSVFSIFICMCFFTFYVFFEGFNFDLELRDILKKIAFSVFIILTSMQVYFVLMIFSPLFQLKFKMKKAVKSSCIVANRLKRRI